ncbi:MAG: iron-containing alcohol dehydrogenase [Gammaproteobacteria bacterium]|nr:iron-containing alcohol dehydrogenase [Gammaproteobacteria bacterium]MYD75065.1 iron-containing alcohol dehydrogenase [Gammaproteobacteria bacterium]MYJ53233.1 iron-containing alcohol dehydrogenase [Gammaproteobacteria bacterium]
MSCQHFDSIEGGARSFTVAMPKYTFGRGTLQEAGARAASHGMKTVAFFTDRHLADGPYVSTVKDSLAAEGIGLTVFSDIRIEPDDATVMEATRFLRSGRFDGVVSVGGGSVIDTAKAAMVYALYPSEFTDYFGPPVGAGLPVPGPLLPHLACPTTSGTGSECTSVSVIRLNSLNTKFVMGSPHLLPQEALVDPVVCETLPGMAVASTGFDLLCHAIECYTAKAYTQWPGVDNPLARTMLQGANPWSDMAARKALEIVGKYLERGVGDPQDREARDSLMFGASLAGMAFGNSGTHLPHAMSYGITHLMDDITTAGYEVPSPFIPHGISVVVNAPAIFRYLAGSAPERHAEAAGFLGAEHLDAVGDEVGELVSGRIVELMRAVDVPNGIRALGFDEKSVKSLAESSCRQTRAINNAPRVASREDMESIYLEALSYW